MSKCVTTEDASWKKYIINFKKSLIKCFYIMPFVANFLLFVFIVIASCIKLFYHKVFRQKFLHLFLNLCFLLLFFFFLKLLCIFVIFCIDNLSYFLIYMYTYILYGIKKNFNHLRKEKCSKMYFLFIFCVRTIF